MSPFNSTFEIKVNIKILLDFSDVYFKYNGYYWRYS